MGGFYGSIQIRTDDRDTVIATVERLSAGKTRFLIGPPLGGWVGIYPEGSGQDLELAGKLARHWRGEIVAMLVHDDDIFAYEYHRDGVRVDQYNSVPDYFGKVPRKQAEALRGHPETFAHLAIDPERFERLAGRLADQATERDVFVSELMKEFAAALGIRNARTSYEYLTEHEETEDIEGWDEFVHVPDLTSERAQRAAAETALVRAKQVFVDRGQLLAERGGLRGFDQPTPCLCPAPDGQGFLVAWSSRIDPDESLRTLEWHGPPWTAGPRPTPWAIGPLVFGLELSPSGRYLAVAHAAGHWKAAAWDLIENRLVAESAQVRAVSDVGFLPDESAMFSASSHGDEGKVILTPLGPGSAREVASPQIKRAAVHPSGDWLVVADQFSRLLVVDIATGRIARTALVGHRQEPGMTERLMAEQARSELARINANALEEEMRQQHEAILATIGKTLPATGPGSIEEFRRALDDQIAQMREEINLARAGKFAGAAAIERGSEIVFRLGFDPSGQCLFAATSGGVRSYDWSTLLDDGHRTVPRFKVDVEATPDATSANGMPVGYIYDLAFDPGRDRLLFAGLEGRVRYLDPATGDSGVLLEPPGLLPVHSLALSRDGATLALTVHPEMYSNSRNKRGPLLQFWDYQSLDRRESSPTS